MKTFHYFLPILTLTLLGCSKEAPTETKEAATEATGMSTELGERAGVKLQAAAPGMLRETLSLYGSIQANPDRTRKIAARYPGVVRSVLHDVGDQVAAGEKLASVESNESLQIYAVTTPLAGTVTARHTNVGEVANESPLFEVADYSQVRAELSVFPRDRARLKPGQSVRIIAADGAISSDGKLMYIAPAGNGVNQTLIARVVLNNKDSRWAAGQFVTGEVVLSESQSPIVVVPTAIQQIKGDTVVFVQNGNHLESRPIDIGRRATNAVEVKSGLEAGEMYVTENSYLVKADLLKNEAEED